MKSYLIVVLIVSFLSSCTTKSKEKKAVANTTNFTAVTTLPTVSFEGLGPWLTKNDTKTYVVNFWATWCSPCVKELPYFEALNLKYKEKNVDVILVSLDFPNQKEKRLLPYINKKKLQSKIIHLDDANEQEWIAKVSDGWSGAIPATLIYNKDKRKFYEQSFTYQELENQLKQFIN